MTTVQAPHRRAAPAAHRPAPIIQASPAGQPGRLTTSARQAGCALLLASAALVQAGPLADPTRPPATLAAAAVPAAALGQRGAPAPAASGPGAAARLAAAALSLPANPLTTEVLQSVQSVQSVQLPVRGPAVAMIDGQLVQAGDKVGQRVVLSIDSQGLVLRSDTGTERLWLLGASAKQAPGSITISRTASFVPAPSAPDPAPEAVPTPRTERNASPPALPAVAGTLSLAGKTPP